MVLFIMSYIQLISPDLSTKGSIGYCLQYARQMFGAAAVEPSAWAAWGAARYRHQDTDVPANVAVPLFFSYFATINGTYANWGHVVVSVPGQGLYSSPWQSGTDHAVLPTVADVERIYGVSYVGWTEDISQLRVVDQEENMATLVDANILEDLSVGLLGRTSVGDKSLQNWLGVDVATALAGFIHYPEHQALMDRAADPAQAKLDEIKKIVN